MKSNPLKRFPKTFSLILLALAFALGFGLAVHPVALEAPLPGGQVVQSWRWEWARWLYWPALAAAAAGCWLVWRTTKRGLEGSRWGAFLPLAWLPLLAFAPHGVAWADWTLAGLLFPLGGALLAALCLERLAFGPASGNGGEGSGIPVRIRHSALLGWLLFLAATVLLSAYWRAVAEPQGYGHGGDAVYYRMMVDNLLDGKGLEMTDHMVSMMEKDGFEPGEKNLRAFASHHHMKTNAEGKIYNLHSFGFPLAAWPVFLLFGAAWGETLSMALAGAMALAGVFFCCLVHGASRRTSALVTALVCLSFVWVYTTFWFSPEMLGFGLVAWAFWAVAAQHDPRWRWVATAVATLACAWMPVAHVRFAPTAAALAACFGIEGLLVEDEPFWRGKVWRLGAFTLLCFAAWGALWAVHQRIYCGTSPYNYGRIMGRDPFAVWALFCDRRGIVALLPAGGAMIVATVFAAFRRGTAARRAAMAAAVVAATMYFCCCTSAVLEGLCLGGRYALTFVPVLLPFFAMALERADRAGRVWLLFLAVQPVLFFAFAARSAQGGALYFAPAFLRGLPAYSLFWDPFPSQYGAVPAAARAGGSLVGGGHLRLVGAGLLASPAPRHPVRARARPARGGVLRRTDGGPPRSSPPDFLVGRAHGRHVFRKFALARGKTRRLFRGVPVSRQFRRDAGDRVRVDGRHGTLPRRNPAETNRHRTARRRLAGSAAGLGKSPPLLHVGEKTRRGSGLPHRRARRTGHGPFGPANVPRFLRAGNPAGNRAVRLRFPGPRRSGRGRGQLPSRARRLRRRGRGRHARNLPVFRRPFGRAGAFSRKLPRP